jgi:hypothetical protein
VCAPWGRSLDLSRRQARVCCVCVCVCVCVCACVRVCASGNCLSAPHRLCFVGCVQALLDRVLAKEVARRESDLVPPALLEPHEWAFAAASLTTAVTREFPSLGAFPGHIPAPASSSLARGARPGSADAAREPLPQLAPWFAGWAQPAVASLQCPGLPLAMLAQPAHELLALQTLTHFLKSTYPYFRPPPGPAAGAAADPDASSAGATPTPPAREVAAPSLKQQRAGRIALEHFTELTVPVCVCALA